MTVRSPSNVTCSAVTLSIMLVASISRSAAEVGQAPTQIAALCAACHRLDNKPNGIAPIVSLGSEQIIAMMRGFKAREQSSPIMHVVSGALSDAEIVAVAGYLSRMSRKTGQ